MTSADTSDKSPCHAAVHDGIPTCLTAVHDGIPTLFLLIAFSVKAQIGSISFRLQRSAAAV